ncbi:MAG: hypothetical protein EOO13_06015 [Chitinophagaceae bacterium]|nr:MAG: hypothetical protein EOO13_06015 [Chitinophagaceae bacterium]
MLQLKMDRFQIRIFLLCISLVCSSAFLKLAKAQIPEKKAVLNLKNVLDSIAKDHKVNFMYESKLLNAGGADIGKLKIKRLDDMLAAILQPLSIGYYRVDHHNYALFRLSDGLPKKHFGEAGTIEKELFSISGNVVDQSKRQLAYSTVLLQKNDSVLVSAAIADSLGRFRFNLVPKGAYRVKATRLGYRSASSATIELPLKNGPAIDCLVLVESPKSLAAVLIGGHRPIVEYRADRSIINVGEAFPGASFSIYDVLEISPGFAIANGRSALMGRQDLLFMIDGNPIRLADQQLASLLMGMPASSVSQIELIHSPSAKYSAQGSKGIINFKMQNNQQRGLTGTFGSLFSMGSRPKFSQAVSVRYNFGKLGIFGSYDHQQLNNESESIGSSSIGSLMPLYFGRQENGVSKSTGQSALIGAVYQIDPKNSVSLNAGFNISKERSGFARQLVLNGSQGIGSMDSLIRSLSDGLRRMDSHTLNVASTHDFGPAGHSLSFFAGYNRYGSEERNGYQNSYLGGQGRPAGSAEKLSSAEYIRLRLFSVGMDYSYPLGRGHQLEAGAKVDFGHSDSRVLFRFENSENGPLDPDRTNNFSYREMIRAAYLNYKVQLDSATNLQIGVRVEGTNYKSVAISGDQASAKDYAQFFPNIMLSRAMGRALVSLAYNRRLGRPSYQDLNPFINYFSPYQYAIGNQFLRPENTHVFEIGYIYGKLLSFRMGYSLTNDYLSTLVSLDGGTLSARQAIENFHRHETVSIAGEYLASLGRFWKASSELNLFYDRYQALYLGEEINNGRFGINFSTTSSFRLHPKISLEALQRYQSRRAQLSGYSFGRYSFDASVNYSFGNGQAKLRLGVNDLFYSDLDKGSTKLNDFVDSYSRRNENRRFHLGLTCSFGKKEWKSPVIKENPEQLKRIKP